MIVRLSAWFLIDMVESAPKPTFIKIEIQTMMPLSHHTPFLNPPISFTSFNYQIFYNYAFIIPNNHILFEMQQSNPWQHLQQHYQTLKNYHLRDLLRDQKRNSSLLAEYEDIIFDYTHEKITLETVQTHFQELVKNANLKQRIQGLFNGDRINFTEDRAVLHTCLRAPLNSDLHESTRHEMRTILDNVHGVLKSIREFSERVRSGAWTGATGKQLVNLIVIGIGGSYLSIEFVYEALRSHPEYKNLAAGRKIRFLANVDPIDLDRATDGLNPEQTLILVNSKTFTTAETLLNAKSCKQWLINQYAQINVTDVALIAEKHICACSTNLAETSKFGINSNNVFGFWDFVGGRFSVWSAIGIAPLAIHFGFDTASEFLSGGHSIDRLFLREESLEKNIPLLFGLIGFYRSSVQGYTTRAIIPYCQALCKFAPHIQQLDMESNGKRVNSKGEVVNYPTGVVNFGEPGTNGQHSFFQLLHQGRATPVQFIGFMQSQQPYSVVNDPVNNHDELMSNFFSQPDALAIGKTREQLIDEKTPAELLSAKEFPGDRPSSSILFRGQLDAYKCGQLLAIYEHRTSVQGFIWDINSYDQYGVELGKVLAKTVRGILHQGKGELLAKSNINSATKRLINEYLSSK